MDQKMISWAQDALEKERKQLLLLIDDIDDAGLGESLTESVEELSAVDQHPADVASELFERSKDFALRENTMLQIRAIEQALSNIRAGSYGLCDVCGREISLERLQALPHTTYCLKCSQEDSRLDKIGQIRPVEEEVMEPILAQGFDDSKVKNMYDAEDTWQDLAHWQEHAPDAGAGSYYGGGTVDEEHLGYTEMVDHIPYRVSSTGVINKNVIGLDDEMPPREPTDIRLEQ